MKNTKITVFIGLSGGVDSAVAALRLKRQGYDVVGVFIKVWHPEFLVCNWEQERLDAMRVAAQLDIPFLTCDAEAAYKKDVADYFVAEYAAGRTPNPDVMCNQAVKFGAFLQFAQAQGADYVATGHYAQKKTAENGQQQLLRGIDETKDQSYFLWTLTQHQLKSILFPIGDTTKGQIRQEAAAAGIPTATKKDSQGICFLGHIDIPEFLRHYMVLTPGDVLDESGAVIGTHQGAFVYTIGQRHGFTLMTQTDEQAPLYIVRKDVAANTITASPTPPTIESKSQITLREVNEIQLWREGEGYQAQFRYRQSPFSVTVTGGKNDSFIVTTGGRVAAPADGQSCVLYQGAECLGGGIIG